MTCPVLNAISIVHFFCHSILTDFRVHICLRTITCQNITRKLLRIQLLGWWKLLTAAVMMQIMII